MLSLLTAAYRRRTGPSGLAVTRTVQGEDVNRERRYRKQQPGCRTARCAWALPLRAYARHADIA